MGVHSGRFAIVDGVDTVRNWNISETTSPARFVASNTRNGTGRRKGIRSWTGSYAKYGAKPLHMPGEFFNFLGYTAPDDDTEGGQGLCYSGSAIVDSVALMWNWQNGEILSHSVNFSGHLALTVETDDDPQDLTEPDVPEVWGTKLAFGADVSAAETVIANMLQATLNISSSNQSYVNSSTYIGDKPWTGRTPGNIDWSLAAVIQDNIRTASVPVVGEDTQIKLYIDDTLFWLLYWGHVRDYTGLTADRDSGAILQGTMNLDMNASLGGDIGRIQLPGESEAWWPVEVGSGS